MQQSLSHIQQKQQQQQFPTALNQSGYQVQPNTPFFCFVPNQQMNNAVSNLGPHLQS
jgi:hypothetical protein